MRVFLSVLLLTQLIACSPNDTASNTLFDESHLRQDIKILSSDKFEGRAPNTRGEKLTLQFLTRSFGEMGLTKPNGKDYLQAVPMISYAASEQQVISLGELSLNNQQDIILNSRHDKETISIRNAPLVFVGYGINAPEYHWNDYRDLDMKGKIALILVNDPGFSHPESDLFGGKAMSYYGRWTYKFEEASRQGALGAIIIHQTKPAGYPWSVVVNSWNGPQQDLQPNNEKANNEETNNTAINNRVNIEGWITFDKAKQLFNNAGLPLKNLLDRASASEINLPLNMTASIAFKNKVEYSTSYNVIATLPGTDQTNEHVLFTAHWDHIGTDKQKTGDNIYNGAVDNASGTAGMLAIARQFIKQIKENGPLARSITFIATTGEEQGLLGSRYYVQHPLYPLDATVAVFNLDSSNIYGPTKDYIIIGKGKSELENYLIKNATRQERHAISEANPEVGGFFRSDHFSFAQKGVPAVFAGGGNQPIDAATSLKKEQMKKNMQGCYHDICDEYREDWDLRGALEDLTIYYQAANELANNHDWPGYYGGTEFYSLRPAHPAITP
ncbi:M28 family metallopeptidase [Shewanella surugensis]|uniref:M28 family metallopeptidase n=1 Tax=Shewanella surugensis TaxID=212020 RepID=A0ABT0LGU0_9GAMM|nr:M28 family metallopeptidase [Shewanella surugensis]MCL1126381.1 M28 family metallopeptidase [Shewanella surugensis]